MAWIWTVSGEANKRHNLIKTRVKSMDDKRVETVLSYVVLSDIPHKAESMNHALIKEIEIIHLHKILAH